MENKQSITCINRKVIFMLAGILFLAGNLFGLTINVVEPTGGAVTNFRWLIEEDNTHPVTPGVPDPGSLSFSIHKSTATVIAAGDQSNATVAVDETKRYIVSVLPDSGFTNGGGLVAAGQTLVTINVNPLPIPTAQISVLVFHDNAPLNNAPDIPRFGVGGTEQGLEGFSVVISDFGGQQMLDAFGNMLGTTYEIMANGEPNMIDGQPVVTSMGNSVILTDANGEALIKYLAPNKYAVVVVPPAGMGWTQTSTIEGKPVIDAWVKADEPPVLVEFGPPLPHTFFGFIKDKAILPTAEGTATITGRAVKGHSAGAMFYPGPPIPNAYIGLNSMGLGDEYLYAAPADANSVFTIENVVPGTYQIVVWDEYLDSIFAFHTVIVPPEGGIVDVGDIISAQWFGQLEGYIFNDLDRDGFKDSAEPGIGGEEVLLRFRDGTVYQAAPTNQMGFYIFEEVFPWFKYLVAEVGFARFFATGATVVVDTGGVIPADNGWMMPSDNVRTPQVQNEINDNTGNNLSRTEVAEFSGEILLEAMQVFAGQNNRIDWGKDAYDEGENGGVAGIVFYATTRAEDDPRFAAGEPWEPGVANANIVLYEDKDGDGIIDDINLDGVVTLADVDNYPFGWIEGGAMGPEDVKRNAVGTDFNGGDAIQIAATDSWDENLPTDCPPSGQGTAIDCSEGLRSWNQVRPGVFDGGYAITSYFPGGFSSGSTEVAGLPSDMYIVECVAPPGMEHAKEEDRNVDFGDTYIPSTELLPVISVGDMHLVPPELTLFPGVEAPFAGEMRPLPDRKQVAVTDGFNAAAEFFLFTYVPKAARVVGLATDDLTNAFNPESPNFGEKFSPPWLPIAFRDFNGREVVRVYSDEFGAYNALLPSTYTVNIPAPSGVSPQMLRVSINDPGPVPDPLNPGRTIIDPYFKSQWATQSLTFDFWPGKITYLDTPVIPVGAFVGEADYPLDCEFPDETPLIYSAMGPDGGAYVSAPGQVLRIEALGPKEVPNPEFDSSIPGSPQTIIRDYGFGFATGRVTLGCVELTNVSWSDALITATIPEGVAQSGQLTVTRGDNNKSTPVGVTVSVGGTMPVVHVRQGQSIQAAIDAAVSGSLILVDPGDYSEMVIVWKNIKLQGSGAFSTMINALPFIPSSKIISWRETMTELVNPGGMGDIDLLSDQDPNFTFLEGAGITVVAEMGDFGSGRPRARIDGFEVFGSTLGGGGIFVNAFAGNMDISNNRVITNLGNFGGGVTIGHRFTVDDSENDNIYIHNNHITQNTGFRGGGGISLLKGSDFYKVYENFICGNFTTFQGGGICHNGLSVGGYINDNCILFNEAFMDTAGNGGDGGGITIAGEPLAGGLITEGSGSVDIVSNLIQGNLARSGDGGAINLFFVNGEDVEASPGNSTSWYSVDIFNNMIVNNVTALAGAIAMQDAAKVRIIHNTIANNDSTATAIEAFQAGDILSTPQPSGIVARQHTAGLGALIEPDEGLEFSAFSNPLIQDCIVYQNQSYFYNPALNGGFGGVVLDAYWDLAVLPEALGESLDPMDCLLTDTTGFDGSNISGNPNFVDSYFNIIQTASEPAEGGNFIDVNYRPLTKSGDYHIQSPSPAIGSASNDLIGSVAVLSRDIDNDERPFGGDPDIGADEVTEEILIIDNTDLAATSMTLDWIESGASGFYDVNSVYSRTAGATFSFEGERNGRNSVWLWWTAWSSRSTAVQVQIFDDGSLVDTETVNQQNTPSQWVYIGTYVFDGTAKVTITATGNGTSTNADAVKFMPEPMPELCSLIVSGPESVDDGDSADYNAKAYFTDGTDSTVEPIWTAAGTGVVGISGTGLLITTDVTGHQTAVVNGQYTDVGITKTGEQVVMIVDTALGPPATEVVVDNLDAGVTTTGSWPLSGGANPWETNSVYSRVAGDTFTFAAELAGAEYGVYMWWTAWDSREINIPVTISTGGTLLDTVFVNQQQTPSQWVLLGYYTLGANTQVTITSPGGGSTNADAVRFLPGGGTPPPSEPETIILDNGGAGTSSTGAWAVSSGTSPYGANSLWSRGVGDTYTWTSATTGSYDVYAWWSGYSSRHTAVPYTIYDDNTQMGGVVTVNQQNNAGQWYLLMANVPFSTNVRVVVESTTTEASTCADAIRLVEVP